MKFFNLLICFAVILPVNTQAQWVYQNPLPTGASLYEVHFINNERGFIGGDDGLFKTTDGGLNWSRLLSPRDSIGALFFLNHNNGWCGGQSGTIYKTTNSGESWFHLASLGSAVSSLCFVTEQLGFAGASEGVMFRTTNGGSSWTSMFLGGQTSISSVIFVTELKGWAGEAYNNYLWYTTNAGESWIIKGTPGPGSTMDVYFVDTTTGYACGWNGRFIKTTNGGANWFELNVLPPFPPTFFKVLFVNSLKGWTACSPRNYGSIYRTIDGGVSWEAAVGGPDFGQMNNLSFPSDSVGYAVGEYGSIYKTVNGGDSWVVLTKGTRKHITESFFLNEKRGWAVGIRDWGPYSNYENLILKTEDGGEHWTEIPAPHFWAYEKIIFATEQTGWITAMGGILKTTDGGNTWFSLNAPSYIYRGLYFLNENVGWTVRQDRVNPLWYSTLMYTSDGGVTWSEKAQLPVNYLSRTILFLNRDIGFINGGGYGGIYKTTDGGSTWQETLTSEAGWINHIFFVDDSLGFGAGTISSTTSGFVVKTTNQGATWSRITEGYFPPGIKIEFADEKNGIIACGSFHTVRYTTDQGETWTPSSGAALTVSFVRRDAAWVMGIFGSIRKLNSGLTVAVNFQDLHSTDLYLHQNYPNPFNPTTTISYSIPRGRNKVKLSIYDILGNEIALLVNEEKPAGEYQVEWDASAYSSGVYFYRLKAGEFTSTKKLLLMK